MDLVISPYHLTTREPPALAAAVLSSRAITFLPEPFSGADARSLTRAVAASPRYLQAMDAWRWSQPLWDAGLFATRGEHDATLDHVHEAWEAICSRDDCAPLRSLLRPDLFAEQSRYLDAISRDLLRGGPDPGISLPVAAGLDRFACSNRLAVLRTAATSVAQRVEDRLAKRLLTVAVPLAVQADAHRLADLRQRLDQELDEFRIALRDLVDAAYDADLSGASLAVDPARRIALDRAASALTRSFESQREQLLRDARADEVRLIDATCTLTIAMLPADAVLQSGIAAMQALTGRSLLSGSIDPARAASSTHTALAVRRDALDGRGVVTIVVKPLGSASGGRSGPAGRLR